MTTLTLAPARIFGLQLQSDVSRRHFSHFLISSFAAILLASFLPQMQAFMFTEFLQLPESRHGRVSGMLNFWQEIVIIAVVALVGPLSDQWGRKPLMAGGFLVMALGIALHPLARDIATLLACRCVFAVGVAAVTVMLVTLLADYVDDGSRGKAAGMQGIMNGLGAMVAVFLLLRLPSWLQTDGRSAIEAGTLTYLIAAAISAVAGAMMIVGLRGGRPRTLQHSHEPFLALARAGYQAAKDPHIALAYGASFIARGNLAIVGTFLALWATNYGTEVVDMSRADALARAGMLVGIAQGMALLSAPLFGLLADRIDRVQALGIALIFSAIGYGGTFFVSDPFGGLMMGCAIFIGLGEVGCIITSGVLISQQSAERYRGAIIGTFNLSGAIGILVASAGGGWLFDRWREPGPFVAFGLLALVVAIAAFALRTSRTPQTA